MSYVPVPRTQSNSIWYEEIVTGLKEVLSVVKYTNNGVLTPVPITSENPAKDKAKYPCIVLKDYDLKFDPMRYNPNYVLTSKDTTRYKGIEESPAIPYNIYYQIDFWSTTLTHASEMLRYWLAAFNGRGYLNVHDKAGIAQRCAMLQVGHMHKAEHKLESGLIVYQRVFSYNIQVYLDEGDIREINLVKEVVIDISKRR
jgi:hypothetical protein